MALFRKIRHMLGSQPFIEVIVPRPLTNKFGAKKVEIHGFQFDSEAEAARYVQLLLRYEAGEIQDFVPRPLAYELVVRGVKVGTYKPDFLYKENGQSVTEDVKGCWTKDARLRIKLFEACYPECAPVRIVRMEEDMVERLLATVGHRTDAGTLVGSVSNGRARKRR